MQRLERVHSHLSSSSSLSPSLLSPTSSTYPGGILQGKVAIVTGSGQGIGEATAKLFAKEGAAVVVTDLDAAKAEAVHRAIEAAGGRSAWLAGDITAPEIPDKLVALAVSSFGTLDIVINNAGYTWDAMLHTMTDAQWEAMQKVHTLAPFRLLRAASAVMREAAKKELAHGQPKDRVVVNVSSTSGLHGNVGQANYACAKLGVVGLTKTVAKEWGPFNIRCNAVAFGSIQTRLTAAKEKGETISVDGKKVALGIPEKLLQQRDGRSAIPLGRSATAEEAAGSILLLCSPFASYITGHCLEVTGGVGI